jgi:hypothetical protein
MDESAGRNNPAFCSLTAIPIALGNDVLGRTADAQDQFGALIQALIDTRLECA